MKQQALVNIFDEVNELLSALADFLIESAAKAIKERGEFTLVLSGGNSPKKLYELLASPAYKHKIDWTKVYFFFGDERYVPADDPENNGLMATLTLFDVLPIPEDNIYMINTALAPEHAAESYFETIQSHFKEKPIRFDFILLGLGDNAHTASLFPYTSVLSEHKATVEALFVKELKAFRITFTAPLINQAVQAVFLVYGEGKANAVKQILESPYDPERYPAQLIQPNDGFVYWFLDKAASSLCTHLIKKGGTPFLYTVSGV